jgi:hypothetical protein
VRIAGAVLVAVVSVFGALIVFGWTVDETRFDRPDRQFDRLTARVESTPGVKVTSKQRWVEAPTFSGPSSWIELTVDQASLPGLLATACANGYHDNLDWSLHVTTDTRSDVSMHSVAAPGGSEGDAGCPEFGFNIVAVVEAIKRADSGLDLQPAIWENGRFTLVVLDGTETLSDLLPLVEHAAEIRDAAGTDPRGSVEINSATLGAVIPPTEHDLYLALLSELVEKHEVRSFWADNEPPADGIEKVQIIAPDREHADIAITLRTSGLDIAGLPVRFIPYSN